MTTAVPARASLLLWAVALPLLAASLVDIPGIWRLDEWSWLGILPVAQLVVAGAALLAAGGVPRPLRRALWPVGALLAWIALGTLWWPANPDARPNALAYLLLGVTVSTAAVAVAWDGRATARAIDNSMLVLDVIGLSIVAVSFAQFGFNIHAWIVHPRNVALVALVPICWHLARWSFGHWSAIVPTAAWVAAIFVSLSRMATGAAVIAIVLIVGLHLDARWRASWRHVAMLVVLLAATLVAVATVDPFRHRLLMQDRLPIWQRVASSALEAPVTGNGLGSSQTGPVLLYWWTPPPEVRPRSQRYEFWEYWVPHPHNEYLRVWHDLGLPGLALFAMTLAVWLRVLYRGWRSSNKQRRASSDPDRPPLELAGLLMLVVLMVAMTTDNPLVYPFVISPAAVLIGAGLGAALATDRDDAARLSTE